jgi:collagen type VII alpha
VSTLGIGTVVDVSYGSAGAVTIDNTDPANPLLNFSLRQGNPGPTGATGATGATGPAGSDADVSALGIQVTANSVAIAAGAATAVTLQAQISSVAAGVAVNNGLIAVANTEIGVLDGEVSSLQARCINIASAVPTVSTNHTGTLNVRDSTGLITQVQLNASGTSHFYNGLETTTLSVDSTCTIGSTLDVTGSSTIGGNLGITGELSVDGATTLTTLDATGDVVIGGTLDITGDTTCTHIEATNSVTTSFLEATGSTELGGDLASLSTHVINGASLTVNCALVSIPALSLSGFFSQLEGYTLTL